MVNLKEKSKREYLFICKKYFHKLNNYEQKFVINMEIKVNNESFFSHHQYSALKNIANRLKG